MRGRWEEPRAQSRRFRRTELPNLSTIAGGGSSFTQPAPRPAQAFPGHPTTTLPLPEPGAMAGLVLGGAALLGLARPRRRPVAS